MTIRWPKRLDSVGVEFFTEAYGRLTPSTPRRFGTLEPAKACKHVALFLRIPLGEEQPPADVGNPFTRNRAFLEVFLAIPWPKGRVKVPACFTPEPEDAFEQEQAALLDCIRRFGDEAAEDPYRRVRNPLLGPITLDDWSRLNAKHLRHHALQFGLGRA